MMHDPKDQTKNYEPIVFDAHVIAIDTDAFVGWISEELLAYTTGYVVDAYNDQPGKIAKRYAHEIEHIDWWSENLSPQYRLSFASPITHVVTKGLFNASGKFYNDDPSQYQIAIDSAIMEEKRRFKKSCDNIADYKITANYNEHLKVMATIKEGIRHPAYGTLHIYVKALPPAEVLEEFVARSNNYFKEIIPHFRKPIKITGFRKMLKDDLDHSYAINDFSYAPRKSPAP